jgi:hypothetical protein
MLLEAQASHPKDVTIAEQALLQEAEVDIR